MNKRFSEEQIIGFLREAEAGLAVPLWCPLTHLVRTLNPLRLRAMKIWFDVQWAEQV